MNCKERNLKQSCRACLTQGKKMVFLDNPLNKASTHSILEILEMITYTKVKLNESYPCVICTNCLKLLNEVYDFKLTFESSQETLQNFLNNSEEEESSFEKVSEDNLNTDMLSSNPLESEDSLGCFKECENTEDVEIIYINCTDPHEDSYLHQTEAESNRLEVFENSTDTKPKFRSRLKKYRKKQSINVDKYIIECPNTNSVPTDVKNLQNIDDELIQAACNLKYKCSACPKLYSSKNKLEKHEAGCSKLNRAHYPNLSVEKSMTAIPDNYTFLYECVTCPQTYPSMEELHHHSETAHDHTSEDAFLNLKAGLSDIDKELFRSALLLKFQCDGCTKVYSSQERFKRHKAVCRKVKKKMKLK